MRQPPLATLWTACAAALTLCGCARLFAPTTGGTLSDVPCLTPSEWPEDTSRFLHRPVNDTLLFTAQSLDDVDEDRLDGNIDHLPHQAVYRLDAASGEFSIVDDADWDDAGTDICDGCGDALDQGAFRIEDDRLLFNGRVVPVAGRRAINIFDPAISGCSEFGEPTADAVAVLSIDGFVTLLGASSGQHYHQLFSKADGSQIGPTKRLAMGGGAVFGCWTADHSYVVYQQDTQRNPIAGRICVVPVAEDLALVGGE